MINPLDVIDKYYSNNDKLRNLLLHHSWQVATLALRCEAKHAEYKMDRNLILRGSLLHDIGIFGTHAPSIGCYGTEHYLMHGFVGAQLLREMGMEAEARICERHTGAGLSKDTIVKANLDIVQQDYYPETKEEMLICYADKFFSKSRPQAYLSFQEAYDSLLRFGQDQADRFKVWHDMFA